MLQIMNEIMPSLHPISRLLHGPGQESANRRLVSSAPSGKQKRTSLLRGFLACFSNEDGVLSRFGVPTPTVSSFSKPLPGSH